MKPPNVHPINFGKQASPLLPRTTNRAGTFELLQNENVCRVFMLKVSAREG